MSEPIKQLLRLLALLLVQALLLNHIPPVSRFASPILYFLFLLWLPFSVSRVAMLFIGFITGFALDLFTKTPGMHASACLLVAYVRPLLIGILVPRETRELATGSPSIASMGLTSYLLYTSICTLVHHGWLILLEWMSFGDFVYFLVKTIVTTILSLLLIFTTELLFRPLKKKR
jgi:rod shape-determining protein MreD